MCLMCCKSFLQLLFCVFILCFGVTKLLVVIVVCYVRMSSSKDCKFSGILRALDIEILIMGSKRSSGKRSWLDCTG